MNRHNKGDLQQMQSLPLEAKILMTQRRIRDWVDYWHGDVYVSFSGGKDSTVLKHIVDGMYDNIPAVFVNTGLEYPEIQQFVREIKAGKYDCFNSDVEIIRPEMRFDEVVKEYGYPVVSKTIAKKVGTVQRNGKTCQTYRFFQGTAKTKDGNPSIFNCPKWEFLCDAPFKIDYFCCDIMKKKPFKSYEETSGRKPITGVMASESKTREAVWCRHGCNIFKSANPASQPLSFWTEDDIWEYIRKFDVPYSRIYDQGINRTGCMFCMFGCHLEKEPNRFQRMKETHPKQYAYCMDQLGLKEVLEYIGVPYE